MAEQSFHQNGIIPDLIRDLPLYLDLLEVKYLSNVEARLGNELKPRQVQLEPQLNWNADPQEFYTVILADPDIPSREDPKEKDFKHWLVINIPGHDVKQGQAMTEYVGSAPPEKTGLHRYVFLVYRQGGTLAICEEHIDSKTLQGRPKWNVQKFADDYQLGPPVAGNFFVAEWDDYVPEVYKNIKSQCTIA
ncbi:hypothetical protein RvY_19094 [Ramazzottius varieornatus]|uniref:Uncharacterized protein n=1 Tax=Ramazzottius varieornatus TaxID=947166 RepID=A0A1D1W8C6_RAMVA|nr:hypothetical protein RvY_19094 [Ramazzottius varieornatus]